MYPLTRAEIAKLVRKTVLPTRAARSIIRKSGVRRTQQGTIAEGAGVLIMSATSCIYVSGGDTSDPT